jgi:hypothetical protein
VRFEVTGQAVEIQLAWWERILGLVGNVHVARDEVTEVTVVQNPMREVMLIRFKIGLRLPWLYYVARSIRLDQAFFVRRGVPALSFSVSNHYPLERVLVSTPDAEALARLLSDPQAA